MTVTSDQDLWDVVQSAVVTVLSVAADTLRESTRLVDDLGADSLALVEIVEVSEEQLRMRGVSLWVDDDTLSQLTVLGDLVSALRSAKEK
jgi:acyl carrier protein